MARIVFHLRRLSFVRVTILVYTALVRMGGLVTAGVNRVRCPIRALKTAHSMVGWKDATWLDLPEVGSSHVVQIGYQQAAIPPVGKSADRDYSSFT
jgi:hypothetical protein